MRTALACRASAINHLDSAFVAGLVAKPQTQAAWLLSAMQASKSVVHELSNDLSAKILSHMEPAVVEAARRAAIKKTDIDAGPYVCFHKLRLVCKRFRQVFQEHPHLSAYLFLHDGFPSESLPSLVRWLQLRSSSVQIFIATRGSPWTEAALTGMLAAGNHTSHLTTVFIQDVTYTSISVLSAFQSLTSCEFSTNSEHAMSLAPLAALPHLHQLRLSEGWFMDFDQFAHLQDLSITKALATNYEDCVFVSSLQRLSLVNSILDILHDDGMSACIALQSFTCHGSNIATRNSHDENAYLRTEVGTVTCLPPDLSGLTQLIELSLHIKSVTLGQFDVSWVYALTRLQTLVLHISRGRVHVGLTNNLTALSNLVSLSLCLPHESSIIQTERVHWHAMLSLQCLEFDAQDLYFSPSLLGLFHLKQLRSVSFVSGRPTDNKGVEVWRTFMEQYRVGKPGFRLSLYSLTGDSMARSQVLL